MKVTCYTDGSCRFNPHGEMSYAYIIELPDQPVIKFAAYEPENHGNTSVLAEYKAFEFLLLRLIQENLVGAEVIVNTDCNLIYRQFNHGAKPRQGFYVTTAFEVARLVKRFKNIRIVWISRDENTEAHCLASNAMESAS
jgi:ribonuclease HI